MGVIGDHIKKKLERDLRSGGLLVWLDKEKNFTELADVWIEQKVEGRFFYDIFAFRGSFLELMVQSRELLSGRESPKCVIHMPGFNEQEIRKTPAFEAYKAGRRWRISLETMIREAAQGRLSEAQIDFLLSKKGLTLAEADEYIAGEEDIPPEIKGLLQKYGEDGLIPAFLRNPAVVSGELRLEANACYEKLEAYFGRLVGLDARWRADWNPNQGDAWLPEDQADLLAAYLMAMEFTHDLRDVPKSERLARLKEKPKEYAVKSSALLHEIRERDPELYKKWAEQIEANLTEAECAHRPDELGSLDTFRFEADIFLKAGMNLLEQGRWTDALEMAGARLPGKKRKDVSNTFWLRQDPKRLWLWEWIDGAARLGKEASRVRSEVRHMRPDAMTHESAAEQYATHWWRLDQTHRKFRFLSERCQSTPSNLDIGSFHDIRKSLYVMHRACIDEQADLWNRICETNGFLPPESLQQRCFFNNRVKPMLRDNRKTALFFVDGLRYELGEELARELKSMGSDAVITPMLAELPTVTAVGMNVLVPVSKDGKAVPLFDVKGRITGFQGGERRVSTPEDRRKALEEHAGMETGWINIDDLLAFTDAKLKKNIDKPLLAVSALDIDKMGESGALGIGIDYFEKGIARIKTAVVKLKENGYDGFLITSDHGFLLGDETLETGRGPKLECAERRFAYGTERNSDTLVSAGLSDLNYVSENKDRFFVFERTTHLMVNRSGTQFYHGGNTFQERVTPVISVSMKSDPPGHSGVFELTIRKVAGIRGYHQIGVIVHPKNQKGLFAPKHIEAQLVSDADIVVEILDPGGVERRGDVLTLPLEKETSIYFKLRGGRRSKVRIYFKAAQPRVALANAESPDYFEVANFSAEPEIPPKKTGEKKTDKFVCPDTIPEEFHTALKHLEKHGALTEQFLVNSLGGDKIAARKARRFADRIHEWVAELPFGVEIDQTGEGKEYRKR